MMTQTSRILTLSALFGALVGGVLAFAIASSLFWGGMIGGALTGGALGVVFVMLAGGE